MLEIKNLCVSAGDQPILRGIDLSLPAGEVHAIMGPNGSGKSTLSGVLAGREGYTIDAGSITYDGEDLIEMPVEERAHRGLFLAFQYPVEIPGVTNLHMLRTAVNAVREAREEAPLNAAEFLKLAKQHAGALKMKEEFLYRAVNEGFSGGEKKRNEVLQLLLLQPRLCILDETDSGLDVDALKTLAENIHQCRAPDRGMLVVTHYQRLLNHLVPDRVHILAAGKLIRSGDADLALEIENKGYGWLGVEDPEGAEAGARA